MLLDFDGSENVSAAAQHKDAHAPARLAPEVAEADTDTDHASNGFLNRRPHHARTLSALRW